MELYLMQHGEALASAVDATRPLTAAGRRSVTLSGLRAAASGAQVGLVVHSGKLRAEQSAALLAQALTCEDVEQHSGLGPDDPAAWVLPWLIPLAADAPVAVVGHMPFMDHLAGLLVAGSADAHVIAFRNGGLVRLVRDPEAEQEAGAWRVSWIITPETA